MEQMPGMGNLAEKKEYIQKVREKRDGLIGDKGRIEMMIMMIDGILEMVEEMDAKPDDKQTEATNDNIAPK
jgi:hypothetical protein